MGRQLGPWTRAVNSGSGNRPLVKPYVDVDLSHNYDNGDDNGDDDDDDDDACCPDVC